MRIVIQRVSQAEVIIDTKIHAAIHEGYLILLGIAQEDEKADADWLVKKIIGLRIFSDDEGKMNQSIIDIDGAIMVISQFTLHASYKKGNRPSFIKAAKPEQAIPLYEYFNKVLAQQLGKPIATGVFGADMKINLTNDGPVTIVMDSKMSE